MRHQIITFCAATGAAALIAGAAMAEDQAPPPPPTPAAAAAPPAPTAPSTPSFSGPLAADVTPPTFDLGLLGKKVTISGAFTGLGLVQNQVDPGDNDHQFDISNAQVFISKADGFFQYYIQVGLYSIPDLGSPYVKSTTTTSSLYDPVPQAFLKIAPNSAWSIEVGKLPTLIGAEYTFSVENMNIERGLLWNQEPAVSRGVQVNYTKGPLAVSASWNDGYYSNRYTSLSGAVTWTFNPANILEFAASGNLKKSLYSSAATPFFQNNGQVYNLIYTHTQGPWLIEPYVQYTHVPSISVPSDEGAFTYPSASTWGAALLVSYAFPAKTWLNGFSLPFRIEYIASSGNQTDGTPNLLYGPGSKAWSLTVTPTYQYKIYFVRAEFSVVGVSGLTQGAGFGPNGTDHYQTRGLLETGILF